MIVRVSYLGRGRSATPAVIRSRAGRLFRLGTVTLLGVTLIVIAGFALTVVLVALVAAHFLHGGD
jgi:hypothetical protein